MRLRSELYIAVMVRCPHIFRIEFTDSYLNALKSQSKSKSHSDSCLKPFQKTHQKYMKMQRMGLGLGVRFVFTYFFYKTETE